MFAQQPANLATSLSAYGICGYVLLLVVSASVFLLRNKLVDRRNERISTTNPYVYRSLEPNARQIRVIRILPALFTGDALHGSLFVINVTKRHRPFKAVSYVWAQGSSKRSIILDGSYFEISDNVYDFLVQLRHSWKHVDVWVDAICINQQDTAERSQQVAFMGDIYAAADEVVIWLGADDGTSRAAVEAVKYWAKIGKKHGDETEGRNVLGKYPLAFSDKYTTALKALRRHPWFIRMWTFQEYVRARHLVFRLGKEELQDIELWTARYAWGWSNQGFLGKLTEDQSGFLLLMDSFTHYENRVVFRGLYQSPDPTLALQELAKREKLSALRLQTALHHFPATDPRDKVFAVLSAIKLNDFNMVPDYKMSCSDVYLEFAKQCIQSSGTLDVLDCAGVGITSSSTLLKLPSWVPDLRADANWPTNLRTKGFAADGNRVPKIDIDANSSTLHCTGYIIDTVTCMIANDSRSNASWGVHVLNNPLPSSSHTRNTPRIQALVRALMLDTSHWAGKELVYYDESDEQLFFNATHAFLTDLLTAVPEAQLQLQCREVTREQRFGVSAYALKFALLWHDMSQSSSLASGEALFEPFLKVPSSNVMTPWPFSQARADNRGHDTRAIFERRYRDYVINVNDNTRHRAMFDTIKGHVGIAPEHLRVGDKLCIVLGSKLPVLLRPSPSGTVYHHVGTCYVYGMMYGEALHGACGDVGSLLNFHIC